MSDSLDDFFAKKDKKKKSKSTFKTIDILEEPVKEKKEKKKRDGDRHPNPTNTELKSENAEDEWKEAVEEEEPDYSGLRIKMLTIEDQNEDPEENGDGDENESSKVGNSWNILEAETPIEPPEVEDEKESSTVAKESSPPVTGKYVPPSMRNNSTAQPSAPSRSTKKYKHHAPNLSSVEDFPTLGMKNNFDSQVQGFEKVKSGGRQLEDPSKVTNHLELGNRFTSLAD